MTLFDAPLPAKTARPPPTAEPPAPPGPSAPVDELACRLTGCTRPLEAHTVTQALIENRLHPQPKPPKKNRKAKK